MGSFLDLFRRPTTGVSPTPNTVSYKGTNYALSGFAGVGANGGTPRAQSGGDFMSLVSIGQPHAIVSSAVQVRASLVSQINPIFRDREKHNKFTGRGLSTFHDTGFSTMLMQAEQHIAYAGNAYFYRDRIRRRVTLLRPDLLSIVVASNSDPNGVDFNDTEAIDAELWGYVYRRPNGKFDVLEPGDVAHWFAEPHPTSRWIGASWIASAVRDVLADVQADGHADAYFQNAAVPRLVYKMDPSLTPTQAEEFKAINEARHVGVDNAYRSLYVGGATDVQTVGSSMKDLAMRDYRGVLESRIAVRSRVPATILGISEGLQGSTLNSGNYDATRRLFADVWFTPHADVLMAALGQIADVPRGAYLSWDPDRVLFLQSDRSDEATIQKSKAAAVAQFVNAGYDPTSVVDAVHSGDMTKLVHSGLLSVQLQPPPDPQAEIDPEPEPKPEPEIDPKPEVETETENNDDDEDDTDNDDDE